MEVEDGTDPAEDEEDAVEEAMVVIVIPPAVRVTPRGWGTAGGFRLLGGVGGADRRPFLSVLLGA